jgi:hypothetical protein
MPDEPSLLPTSCAGQRIQAELPRRMAGLEERRLCGSCVEDTYLRGEIDRVGEVGTCNYCEQRTRTISIGEFADRIEKVFEIYYERTARDPDRYQEAMLRDEESSYQDLFEREGEPAVEVIRQTAGVDIEPASDAQKVLAKRHEDFDAALAGDETEFSEEVYYRGKTGFADELRDLWYRFEKSLKNDATQRNFRNALVFLAPDAQRLQQMNHEVRRLMAWGSIWVDREKHLQDAFQRSTAETRLKESERAVTTQISECWRWLLAPEQTDPMNQALTWHAISLSGTDTLTVRAAKRLLTDERLIQNYGAQRLLDVMDQFHLWGDGPHVATETLWEYSARYLYLPRLRDSTVLAKAIEKGLDLTGSRFGYAAEATEDGRYLDLTRTQGPVRISTKSVLLKAEDAVRIEQEQTASTSPPVPGIVAPELPFAGPVPQRSPASPSPPARPTRYFGSVELNADRSARDFGTIALEVIAHLVAQRGAKVKLRVEIDANLPAGFPEDVIRLVTENGSSLKFSNNAFECDEG